MAADCSTEPQTDTLASARDHARAQAGAAARSGPTVPTSSAGDLPPGVEREQLLWDETVAAGGYAARRLPRGSRLRLADRDGDACVQLLAYNAHNTAERLNVADTVKVQWQAYLGPGALLLSDMGRALLTIVDDTSQRHDALCGGSNRATNDARYGDGRASGPAPNARDLLVLAGAKHGLARVDVGPSINLFKGVRVGDDGGLSFDGDPGAPTHVELRAELDVLVVLANTPHPLDDRADYHASIVRCTAWRPAPGADAPVEAATPERRRALLNTAELLLERAG